MRLMKFLLPALAFMLSAVCAYAAPPDPPTGVNARAGDHQVLVRWTAPINTSGFLVSSYTVTASPGGATCISNTGSPVVASCTVTGLTNDTPYTFSVTATTVDGISTASAPSDAVTPLNGTENVNFIGANGSVKYSASTVGAVGGYADTTAWPGTIYNTGGAVLNTVYSAANVNANVTPTNCTSSWVWWQILCDLALPDTSKDPHLFVYQSNTNAGYTINTNSNPLTRGFVIIDLGAVKNFTTLRIFQMFSDGKVTDVAMSVSSNTGDTWPAESDSSWTAVVPRSPIGAGFGTATSPSYKSCPSVYDFSARSGRYIRLDFWNAGQFGSPNWIETAGAKLFFENTLVPSESSCPPEPPTNASATAGNATATVYWTPPAGSITSYSLQYSTNNGSSWSTATTVPASVPGTATSAQVTGLNNGTSYVFRARASNGVGTSPYSTQTAPVTPTGSALNPPTTVTATGGNASATVSWTASAGATSYLVTGSPSGSCSATAPSVSCLVTGLTNGLTYIFTVVASDGSVTSPVSAQSNSVTLAVPSYAITETASPVTDGMVNCTPNPVTHSNNSICTATPNTGYHVSGWGGTCGGTPSGTGNTNFTTNAVTTDCTVTVGFALDSYTVTATASPSAGGTASCTPNPANHGASSTCTANPNTGYTFANWSGDCAGQGASCTLNNITTAKSSTANFQSATVSQSNIPTRMNGATANLEVTGCSTIDTAVFIDAPAGAPTGTTFPFGLLDFTLTGCTGMASVSVTYSQNLPSGAVYYKHQNGSYAIYPASLGANSVTFTLTDGGAGDADGTVNGSIHDPSGIGVTAALSAPTAIPTLSEWGMILLSSLLALGALFTLRRQNR